MRRKGIDSARQTDKQRKKVTASPNQVKLKVLFFQCLIESTILIVSIFTIIHYLFILYVLILSILYYLLSINRIIPNIPIHYGIVQHSIHQFYMNFSKSFSGRCLPPRAHSTHQAMEGLRQLSSNIPSAQLLIQKLLLPPSQKNLQTKNAKTFWKPDPEALKLELHNLKLTNNKLEEQVIGNKLQSQTLKNEIKRLGKYQRYYETQLREQKKMKDTEVGCKQMPMSENITAELNRKKHLKLKLELTEYKKEIQRLKRIPESNILREYQIEKQLLTQETIKLKAYIKGQMFQKQEIQMTEEVMRSLKEELEKEKGAVRLLDSQNKTVKAKNNIIKKTNRQLNQQMNKMISQLRGKEVQILSLQHQNENLMMKKYNQNKADQETREKEEINSLIGKVKILEDVQRQLQLQNISLKQELMICKQKTLQKDEEIAARQDDYFHEIRQYRQKLEEQEDKLKCFYAQSKPYQMRRNKTSEIYSQKQKLIKPVKVSEIESERLFLKNVMRKGHITGKDLIVNEGYSIQQLVNILTESPIEMAEESALLVARYIIEDDGLESVGIDMGVSEKSTIVVSRLQHLANGYDLYEQQEQRRLEREWRNVVMVKIEQFGRKINQALKYSKWIKLSEINKLLDLDRVSVQMWGYLQTQIFDAANYKRGFSLPQLLRFMETVGGQLKRHKETQTEDFPE